MQTTCMIYIRLRLVIGLLGLLGERLSPQSASTCLFCRCTASGASSAVELVLLLIFWALVLQATPHHTQRLLPLLGKGRGFIEIPISPLLPLRLHLADLDEGNGGGETAGVGSVARVDDNRE